MSSKYYFRLGAREGETGFKSYFVRYLSLRPDDRYNNLYTFRLRVWRFSIEIKFLGWKTFDKED